MMRVTMLCYIVCIRSEYRDQNSWIQASGRVESIWQVHIKKSRSHFYRKLIRALHVAYTNSNGRVPCLKTRIKAGHPLLSDLRDLYLIFLYVYHNLLHYYSMSTNCISLDSFRRLITKLNGTRH